MNCAGADNCLLIERECGRCGDLHKDLFQMILEYAERSKSSWYLSLKEVAGLPGFGPDMDKSVLKRIVVMTFPDLDQMIKKLLHLHSWPVPPYLIVVDGSGLPQGVPEKVCLMTASLLNLARCISRRLKEPCASVLSLSQDVAYEGLRQLLIDLYYYKSAFCDLKELRASLLSPGPRS